MKKILTSLFLAVFVFVAANAQVRQVTGSVKDDKGTAVAYASVKVKGQASAVVADEKGNFKISAASNESLVVSATGFAPTEVKASATTLNIVLTRQVEDLENVVVTAQGIRKKSKEIGYSYAKVSNDEINVGRSPQLTQALAGKVSGLAVYTVNNSVDPAVKVVLRGYRSLTGNNEALVVIDGMQTTATALATINPNDVENVSILKGGQAATLYGSAGVNGALVITTKQGTKGKLKVQYSNSTNFEEISFLPDFQTQYGSGSQYYPIGYGSAGYDASSVNRSKLNWRPYENQQYGDAYDGSMRIAGRVLEDGSSLVVPYSNVDNVRKKSFDIGVSRNNQASFQGGDETGSYYLSVENQKINGIVPGDMSDRTGVRVKSTKEYGNLSTTFNAAFTQIAYDRTTSDFQNDIINTASWVDLTTMRDWRSNKFANPNGYYNDYYNNPYFNKDINRARYKDANFSGSFDVLYKLRPWIQLYNRLGIMNNSRTGKNTTEKFTYSDWAKNDAYIPAQWGHDDDYPGIYRAISDVLGAVADYSSTENVVNNEFQARIQKDIANVENKLTLGYSLYQRYTKAINVSSSSIVVPDVYNVSNRQGNLGGGESNTTERKFGYYADLNTNLKNMDYLNLNLTGRFDATSRFFKQSRAANQYSYFYYGAALSFIVTDAFPSLKSNILNYAKLRTSYNKNGNDNIPLYGLDLAYSNGANFPYGNNVGLSVGNTLPDANLKPEFVTALEFGAELSMLKNRVNLDLTWYDQSSVGQVLTVKVPNSTGFSNLLINVGEVKNFGYEADLKVQVLRDTKIKWDVNVKYSYNDNKVESLYPGITQFAYGGYSYATTNVILGQRFPVLKTTGYYYATDGSGARRVSPTTGYPVQNTALNERGSTLPRHMVGLGSSFTYSDFRLSFNFEYRGGNVIYSDLGRQMTFTGSGAWTSNRTEQIFPNSYYIDPATSAEVKNNSVYVREPEYALWVNNYRLIAENFVTPGWFIKLRDLNLSYNLPSSLVKKSKIFSGANVAIYGRNLFTIVDKKNQFTDPEFSYTSGNGLGISNTLQTPPVRQYGFNVNFVF
ncbi:MAG: SusC/RagA family TonB-linked outer membrane protein [Sediminibacterium sp.]|nr:SusC/RagA family TonB-linked outer membrane protein [Sediminibacterium sp.]